MKNATPASAQDKIRTLADRLASCAAVRRYDSKDEPQSWTLAYHFVELEASFKKFVDVYLPRLMSAPMSEEATNDLLHDIGEEFRHILYHIHAPEYYDHLDAPEPDRPESR